ncbi:protein IQ-DOMAIN 1-like isoform X2 [Dioscorea cayenensis subsp. rotundata]|nr:protein IQ-DOMAIN 1-like isoform X2 [Dioscorea cayenensis subsp. rotundata]XP_039129591.1 protein IQ-DOMAIN 1-like isoform X2 [Dioscorea cayenensis subsp. rotundata]
MGRKGKWFGAVKRVFSPESKEKQIKKSKKKWGFGKSKSSDPSESLNNEAPDPVKDLEVKMMEDEQSKHVYSVAIASAKAAEAAVTAAHAAAEVVRLTNFTRLSQKSKEEVAAIKIQTTFRGYMARRALRALRGLVRLKSMIEGNSVKRQATTTLRCMQTLARVQSQIRSRRIRMTEENQALQRQLLLNREREFEKFRMGEEWDDSIQSKEQIEASLLSKQEATIRRERALAYAFSHQWKSSSRSMTQLFTDPNNPQWGWSWLERWMASRPWECRSTTDKEFSYEHSSVKSITSAYTRRDTISDQPSLSSQKSSRPTSHFSPSTPPSKASAITGKVKSANSKGAFALSEDDSRSMLSLRSERYRHYSVAGSSVRDDESLASSPAVPSYMAPTESARAKSRFHSPVTSDKNETPEKLSASSTKKRLSFPVAEKHGMSSPAGIRRYSGPPKVDIASVKGIAMQS